MRYWGTIGPENARTSVVCKKTYICHFATSREFTHYRL